MLIDFKYNKTNTNMSNIKKEMRKNTIIQIGAGFAMWYFFIRKTNKKPTLVIGDYTPLGSDYAPIYFKDSEYFGNKVIPKDFYVYWLLLAKELDKIRLAFGTPILIKKGFDVELENYASCKAVEIYPQNNNHSHLKEVIEVIKSQLQVKKIEYKQNNNIYIEI